MPSSTPATNPATTIATTIVTANVLWKLGPVDAREALAGVLAAEPDLVGLQEWSPTPNRVRLLRETGRVRTTPGPRVPLGGRVGGYTWVAPLAGGTPVGARTERFELVRAGSRMLSGVGLADREPGRQRLLPARVATIGVFRHRETGGTTALVCYHLTPGVQAGGVYRDDRPRRVRRHRGEVRRLAALVTELLAAGHRVHAVGDSNFDGLSLPGVVSAWSGREDGPGTLGPHRQVDDVFSEVRAATVDLITNASDHRAVIVRVEGPR